MNSVVTLAQQAGQFSLRSSFEQLDIVGHRQDLLTSLAKMPTVVGGVLVVVGALCVLNGYKWHKWVVAVLALLLGLAVGHELSLEMGKSMVVAGALGMLFAVVAIPMMKVSVAVFGGLAGAFLGANAWTLAQASPANAQWAGACMGFIVMAMASFILFRIVVIGFTSIGGAAMLVLGSLALLMQVPNWETTIKQHLVDHRLLLPLLITTAAVGGMILQQSGSGSGKKIAAAPARG